MATLTDRIAVIIDAQSGGAVREFNAATRASEKFSRESQQQTVTIGKLKLSHDQLAAGLRAGVATAAVAGAYALARFSKASITAASDMAETQSKVKVVFGDSADEVFRFGKTAATALGISEQQAEEAAGTFGNFFTAMKIGRPEAAKMSTSLVQLASDLASFNNADPTEVLLNLRSGLAGEAEPLRKYGINLQDATLRQEALRLGLVKSTKDSLPAAIKAQAAYSLILKQTTTAQGDFARTSDGLANQQRTLNAQIKDAEAAFGKNLLPVELELVHFANSSLIPALKGVGEALQNDGVRHAVELAAALYGINKAIKLYKAVSGSDLISVLKRIAAGHTANATAITAEGVAATKAAAQVEALAVAEASAGGVIGAGMAGGLGKGGTMARFGSRLFRAGGYALAGNIAGDVVGGPLGGVAAGAGYGAAVGSVVPGVGTAAGAAIGAFGGVVNATLNRPRGGGEEEQSKAAAALEKMSLDQLLEYRASLDKNVDVNLYGNSISQMRDLADAAIKGTGASKQHQEALEKDAEAAQRDAISMKTLNETLEDHASKALAASGSADAFYDALHSLRKATDENGRSLDQATQKGRDNRDAFRSAAEAILAHANDMKEQGRSAKQVNAYLVEMSGKLRQTAIDTYGNKDAVDKLLARWELLPKKLRSSLADLRVEGQLAGGDLGRGLVEGMQAKMGAVTTEAKILADQTVKAMRLAAQIESPSKKTRYLGEMLAEGLVQGFTGSRAFDKMSKATQEGLNRLQGVFSEARDFRSGVRGDLRDYASASNALGSGASFLTTERARANDLKRFARLYNQLEKKGLRENVLGQFLATGPAAIPAMEELLRNPGAIKAENRVARRIDRLTGRFAQQVTEDRYGPRLTKAVEALPSDLERAFVRALDKWHFSIDLDSGRVHKRRRAG